MSFLHLPRDVLERILQFLPPEEAARSARVCSAFRAAAHSESLWRHFCALRDISNLRGKTWRESFSLCDPAARVARLQRALSVLKSVSVEAPFSEEGARDALSVVEELRNELTRVEAIIKTSIYARRIAKHTRIIADSGVQNTYKDVTYALVHFVVKDVVEVQHLAQSLSQYSAPCCLAVRFLQNGETSAESEAKRPKKVEPKTRKRAPCDFDAFSWGGHPEPLEAEGWKSLACRSFDSMPEGDHELAAEVKRVLGFEGSVLAMIQELTGVGSATDLESPFNDFEWEDDGPQEDEY